jgi:hypothetical protein
LAVLILYGCKKHDPPEGQSFAYDFTYTTNAVVGDSVRFFSTVPGAKTYLWQFGDGGSSTEASPYHVFGHRDSFAVTLIVDGKTDFACTKPVRIREDPMYTRDMCGSKTWRHSLVVLLGSRRDTTFFADDSFPVVYLNKLSVALKTDTLVFSDKFNTTLYFYRQVFLIDGESHSLNYDYRTGQLSYQITSSGLGSRIERYDAQ